MAEPREIEEPVKQLLSEEDLSWRYTFNQFYGHLHQTAPDEIYGPAALTDTSFDRMMHEGVVVDFVVRKAVGHFAMNQVLQDARLREGRVVQKDELPHMIIGSLSRIRKNGEWDRESRETRKQLLAKGLSEHAEYPLISAAIKLGKMLKLDGHEIYAEDAIAASTKWLERVERKKAAIIQSHTGDPAA